MDIIPVLNSHIPTFYSHLAINKYVIIIHVGISSRNKRNRIPPLSLQKRSDEYLMNKLSLDMYLSIVMVTN